MAGVAFLSFQQIDQFYILISQILFHVPFNKSIFPMYKLKLDGRPMSGDIGRGATKESIAFAVQLFKAKDRPPGSYSQFNRRSFEILHRTHLMVMNHDRDG